MMCCACACDAARVAVVVAARRALVCDFVGRGVSVRVDLCEYLHVWCVSRLLQSVMCGAVCGLLLVAGEKSCLALSDVHMLSQYTAHTPRRRRQRAPVLDLQVDPACSAAVFRGLWSQPSCMRKALDA